MFKIFQVQGHNSPLHIRSLLHIVKFCIWIRRLQAVTPNCWKTKAPQQPPQTEAFSHWNIRHPQMREGLWWKLDVSTYLGTVGSRSPACGWGFDKEEVDRLQSHTGHVHCGMCIVCKNQCSTSLLLQSIPHQEHDRLMDWWALAFALLFHLGKTELEDRQNQLSLF